MNQTSNIFEQFWTLLIVAVLLLLVMLVFRSMWPEKRRLWQLLLPVFIAAGGIAIEQLVQTDREKISAVVQKGIKAVENEDCNAIDAIISPDYTDSHHNSKIGLMRRCRELFSKPLVEKNKQFGLEMELSPPSAAATLTVLVRFEKDSFVSQTYKSAALVKVQLFLHKQPNKKWLIHKVELLEIDRQPVKWRQIS